VDPTRIIAQLEELATLADRLQDAGPGLRLAAETIRGELANLPGPHPEWQLAPLTLQEASEESGYSVSQLRRMVKGEDGRPPLVPSTGTGRGRRILRCNLPRKPGHRISPPEEREVRPEPSPGQSRTAWAIEVARGILAEG
jgi:hypothetical protein